LGAGRDTYALSDKFILFLEKAFGLSISPCLHPWNVPNAESDHVAFQSTRARELASSKEILRLRLSRTYYKPSFNNFDIRPVPITEHDRFPIGC
jgi:hypothetical protein